MTHANNNRPVGAAYAPPHHLSLTWARLSYALQRLLPPRWALELLCAGMVLCLAMIQAVHWMLLGCAVIWPDRVPR